MWGGYSARSPSWLYQLAQYGIDGNAMVPEDFLRENVVIANADWKLLDLLMSYVSASTGTDIDWDFVDESGYVRLFQLYEY